MLVFCRCFRRCLGCRLLYRLRPAIDSHTVCIWPTLDVTECSLLLHSNCLTWISSAFVIKFKNCPPPPPLSLCLSRARGEEGGGSAVLLLLLLVLLLRLKGETCLPPSFFFFFFFLRLKGETLRKKSSAGRGGSSWDSLKVGKNK